MIAGKYWLIKKNDHLKRVIPHFEGFSHLNDEIRIAIIQSPAFVLLRVSLQILHNKRIHHENSDIVEILNPHSQERKPRHAA